jgi:hypothetical protein
VVGDVSGWSGGSASYSAVQCAELPNFRMARLGAAALKWVHQITHRAHRHTFATWRSECTDGCIGDAPHLLAYHWHHASRGEWTATHPAYGSHSHLAPYLIPIRWHGDDASVKSLNGRKMFILSLHSEFAVGDPLLSRLVSTIIYDDWIIKNRTIHQLMCVWHWSWQAMLSGVYPSVDHFGEPWDPTSRRAKLAGTTIAGGWKFCFGGATGDWSYHTKFWGPHLHGSSHNYICSRCCASRTLTRLRFQDSRCGAGWKQTRIRTCEFLCALPLDGRHPMVGLPGFCLSLIRCDIMHCCYLGICLVTGAAMIWELLLIGHFGPMSLPIAVKLESAYGALASYCKLYKHQLNIRGFTPATLGSPSPKRYPELHMKAHDSKVIVGECSASWCVRRQCTAGHRTSPRV